MQIRSKGLNKGERYACSSKDIKKSFQPESILFVSFGFHEKSYRFDFAFSNRPIIDGIIISSLSINRRLNIAFASEPTLSFYALNDDRYSDQYKDVFLESLLPKIYEWYCEILGLPDTSIPGVYTLLVEWTGQGFKMHKCRFA